MRINLLYVLLGGLLGTICGFVLANNSYRNRDAQLLPIINSPAAAAALNDQQKLAETSDKSENSANDLLSDSEINAVVLQADQNPQNAALQKNLGLALFRYAVLEQKNDLLATSIRLLRRAAVGAGATDAQLATALADALMIAARQQFDRDQIIEARHLYQKALESAPQAANLFVKLSYTYYLLKPPDRRATIQNLQTALKVDPRNEDALTFLVKVLVEDEQTPTALLRLDELKKINPDNSSIPDLQILVAQSQLE